MKKDELLYLDKLLNRLLPFFCMFDVVILFIFLGFFNPKIIPSYLPVGDISVIYDHYDNDGVILMDVEKRVNGTYLVTLEKGEHSVVKVEKVEGTNEKEVIELIEKQGAN